jgi:hypothetical protein
MADSPGARLRYDAASGGLARLAAPVETLPADYEGPDASRAAVRRGARATRTRAILERKMHRVGPNRETWPNTLTENPY